MLELQTLLGELTSGDDSRAEAAVASLAEIGPNVTASLLALLDSEDVDRRWWAARALAALDDLTARGGLVRALADREGSVRQCAALGLRQWPTADAVPGLVAMLGEKDRLSARLAADALAAIGGAAIAQLIEAATSSDTRVRIEAARALARMEDPNAVPALLGLLDDPSAVVQYWAEEGLERYGLGMVFFRP